MWFAAAVPFVLELAGQLRHAPPLLLYKSCMHTMQSARALEPAADWVPAGQFTTPGVVVTVPTGPPPAQYLFAGQVTGVLLLGAPDM